MVDDKQERPINLVDYADIVVNEHELQRHYSRLFVRNYAAVLVGRIIPFILLTPISIYLAHRFGEILFPITLILLFILYLIFHALITSRGIRRIMHENHQVVSISKIVYRISFLMLALFLLVLYVCYPLIQKAVFELYDVYQTYLW